MTVDPTAFERLERLVGRIVDAQLNAKGPGTIKFEDITKHSGAAELLQSLKQNST